MLYNLISVCGGSLISDNTVITAAHCYNDGVSPISTFIVVLGSTFLFSGGERFETTDVVIHPGWNIETVTDDIALVKIAGVNFTCKL